MKNGDISINVKGIKFSIIENGSYLNIGPKTFTFESLKQNSKTGEFK